MAIPSQLGPYVLTRELSRGAMGVVHEAVHAETGVRYALKVLLDEGLGPVSPLALGRFRREAESLGQLNHPHVVRVHAADLEGPFPYLVQDLLLGGTLGARLEKGPLPVDEAVAIALKLADGVAAAHDLGILHRDLKPDNVVFDDRGEPRLVDFGLARELADTDRLTQTGAVLGTPSFMAPEQARGERGDVRTDVYGLGAVTYAMLTGRPPTEPKSSVMLSLVAAAEEPIVPPRQIRPALSPSLEAVCLRALDNSPERRYGSVREFAEALSRTKHAEDATGRSALAPWLAAASLTVLAGVVGIFLAGRGEATDPAPPSDDGVGTTVQPAEPADVLRKGVHAALADGKGAAALILLDAARRDGHDGEEWTRLRGLALLLQGDFKSAKQALGTHPAADACATEKARIDLLRWKAGWASQGTPQETEDVLAALLRQVEAARDLRDLNHVGPPLVRRTQETVIHLLLQLGERAYLAFTDRFRELAKSAHSLDASSPGAGAISVGWASLLYVIDPTNLRDEALEQLKAGLGHKNLGRRWSLTAKLLDCCLRPGQRISPAELPLVDTQEVSSIERHVARRAYSLMTQEWSAVIDHELLDTPQQAALAWRNALTFCEQRSEASSGQGLDWETNNINIAQLHLFARNADRAQRVLRSPFDYRRDAAAYLRLELRLLLRDDLDRLNSELVDLIERDKTNRYLLHLRAAVRFERGRSVSAYGDVKAVALLPRGPGPRSPAFGDCMLQPVWRTKEETLLEAEDPESAMRARLQRALKRYPK